MSLKNSPLTDEEILMLYKISFNLVRFSSQNDKMEYLWQLYNKALNLDFPKEWGQFMRNFEKKVGQNENRFWKQDHIQAIQKRAIEKQDPREDHHFEELKRMKYEGISEDDKMTYNKIKEVKRLIKEVRDMLLCGCPTSQHGTMYNFRTMPDDPIGFSASSILKHGLLNKNRQWETHSLITTAPQFFLGIWKLSKNPDSPGYQFCFQIVHAISRILEYGWWGAPKFTKDMGSFLVESITWEKGKEWRIFLCPNGVKLKTNHIKSLYENTLDEYTITSDGITKWESNWNSDPKNKEMTES